jgi:cyclopropane fatty-acyl-phospholipid synthase-like methyltransferase
LSATNSLNNSSYREYRTPWDEGPRKAFHNLVESGRLKPGKAVELGSGNALNAIFLAKHGFDVTAIDRNAATIELARKRAMVARVVVTFIKDDLTDLKKVDGHFDVLVDYSTLDDLTPEERDCYVKNVLSLTHAGSQFVLYCLEWTLSWWEKLTLRLLSRIGIGQLTLEPGEVEQRFGEHFYINQIASETKEYDYPRGYAVYLMTRKPNLGYRVIAPTGDQANR